MKHRPEVSVVVPVFNEELCLPELVRRVAAAMAGARLSWQLVAVLDGCTDASLEVLRRARAACPQITVVSLRRTVGQHAALAAGMRYARGKVIVTLDGDLQNPPEEIPRLLHRLQWGCDAVGTVRQARQDRFDRRAASALFSRLARALRLRHRISDPGCMLRAWRRSVVEQFLASGQAPAYLPIQLNRFAASYEELEVQHAPRHAGRSRYSAWSLARLLTRALVSATFPRVLARREPEVACVLDDEASR